MEHENGRTVWLVQYRSTCSEFQQLPNCSISNSAQACLREVLPPTDGQSHRDGYSRHTGYRFCCADWLVGDLHAYLRQPRAYHFSCSWHGDSALTLLATAAVALLCGAGVAALTPLVTAFVPSGLVGFLAGTGVCAATSGRSSTRVIKPYQQEPGESDSE